MENEVKTNGRQALGRNLNDIEADYRPPRAIEEKRPESDKALDELRGVVSAVRAVPKARRTIILKMAFQALAFDDPEGALPERSAWYEFDATRNVERPKNEGKQNAPRPSLWRRIFRRTA
ncbi:MAG: hypothetical protein AB1656_04980 [Candidatus Omnitrophota bacterium]